MDSNNGDTRQRMAEVAPGRDLVAERLRARARRELAGVRETVRVGRYRVGEKIGAGGMGVVFRGADPELKREVAIKLIKLEGDPERTLREARAMATLSHPNVVQVYDVGLRGGELYVVMELVEGGTLREWQKTSPPVDDVLELLLAAGRGLAAAHRAGIVHHDFKSGNVLRAVDGRALVCDFGLAAFAAQSRSGSTLEEPRRNEDHRSVRGGTFGYCAPERLAGDLGDERADQFSFCVTVVEALAGELPFDATGLASFRTQLARGLTLPRPPQVDASAWRALARGLSERPEDRFASMDALLRALRPARDHRLIGGLALAAVVAGAIAVLSPRPVVEPVVAPTLPERAEGNTANETAEALLEIAEPMVADRRIRSAEPIARLAWLLVHTVDEPGLRARVAMAMGTVAHVLGEFELADRALRYGLRDSAGRDRLVLRLHIQMIQTHGQGLADPDRALAMVPAARSALERLRGTTPDLEFTLEAVLGELYADQLGDATAAQTHFERALTVAESNGLSPRRAFGGLGKAAFKRGEWDESERWYRRALHEAEQEAESLGDQVLIRSNLAAVAARQGRLDVAATESLEQLPLIERVYGTDSVEYGRCLFNVGQLLNVTGRPAEAREHLLQAIEIRESLYPQGHLDVGLSYAAYAQVCASLECGLDEMARYFAKAIVTLESIGEGERPEVVGWRASLGSVETRRGNLVEARRLLDRAVREARALAQGDRATLDNALANRGELLVAIGDLEGAEADLRATIGDLESTHPIQLFELQLLAEVCRRRGKTDEAIRLLEHALELAKSTGASDSASVSIALAELLVTTDRPRAMELARTAQLLFAEGTLGAGTKDKIAKFMREYGDG